MPAADPLPLVAPSIPEDVLYPPTILRLIGDLLDVLPIAVDGVATVAYLPHNPGALVAYAHLVGYILPLQGRWQPTEAGCRIRASSHRYRAAVMDVTERFQPPWIALVAQGRAAIERFRSPSPLLLCLRETGLLTATDPEAIAFWDRLGGAARERVDDDLAAIGRAGERLTMDFERHRTGRDPFWRALEIDGLGYDVESIASADDARPLYIEVKASIRTKERAQVHLTRREWQFLAGHPDDAVVDLWSIQGDAVWHRRVRPAAVAPHVPANQGSGSWDRCVIPYEALLTVPG